VLRPGHRVRRDSPGIVVHVRRDQPRPHHRQKHGQAPPRDVRPPPQALGAVPPAFHPLGNRSPIHIFACIRCTTSSTVMAPIGWLPSSTTVRLLRLYLSNSSKTSLSCASGRTQTGASLDSSPIRCSGPARI